MWRKQTIISILVAVFMVFIWSCSNDENGSDGNGDDKTIDPCDPDIPVVLNGDTLPDTRIRRDSLGCVIRISIAGMETPDSNCLSGIEPYHEVLESLFIDGNGLTAIDLSPLESFTNLKFTFTNTHPGANKAAQYLWISEIKLVPVLNEK